ncbi:HTH domain-containing protein [Paenibacillus larvae]|uniref:HTH domain-containing protein n=1 Tax=Paenibacillus larvae TaxID=1464 RepID=UPI0013045CC8|nr:HTH domain-containing protein [Paenibacillus larvae]MDT2291993.1 HTH domain-containing protein [Paenibacillus larvae]
MLNTRAKDMLLRMIVSGHPVRIKHLAEEFHVSTRTIKYDIESIRLWLNEQHLCLQSHTKRGIWIECSEEKKNKLRELLDSGERSAIFLVRKKEIPKFCSSF